MLEKNSSRPCISVDVWGNTADTHVEVTPISLGGSWPGRKNLDAEEKKTYSRSPSEFPAKVETEFTTQPEFCLGHFSHIFSSTIQHCSFAASTGLF